MARAYTGEKARQILVLSSGCSKRQVGADGSCALSERYLEARFLRQGE